MYRLLIAACLVLASPLQAGGASTTQTGGPAAPVQATRCKQTVLINGDFEDPMEWGWTPTSNQGHDLIDQSFPHSGLMNADLGGTWNARDTLSRMDMFMFTVPAHPYSTTLRFYWTMDTGEPQDAGRRDTLTVALYDDLVTNGGGSLVGVLTVIDNTSDRSQTWKTFDADLTGYAGLTLDLRFESVNDGYNRTFFYVDDVTLTSCTNLLYLPVLNSDYSAAD